MPSIWEVKEKNVRLIESLSKELNIHSLTSHILINRGITNFSAADKFLKPSLENLHDPFLLKDMDKAVNRLNLAIRSKERVVIFGDYDVDGISASALLIEVFKELGLNVCYYLPNRLIEGYGISNIGIEFAKKNNVTLAVTVDCGISSEAEVKFLAEQGIDVIVTDHHQPHKDVIPQAAVAIINPKQKDCVYPDKDICGVGVAFKLAQALTGQVQKKHLDLVCLGTLADAVPLLGENRIFVKYGIEVLNKTNKIGLRALFASSGVKNKAITPYFVGYILGPRINAAGRLSSAEAALRLFLTQDEDEAKMLASSLEEQNRKRQTVEEKILKEAYNFVDNYFDFKDNYVIVLDKENWHRGVLGIIASRVADKFHRPTIVISWHGDHGKGSARSIRSFHMFDALSNCNQMLDNYGGHKHAAGLSISRSKIDDFKKGINDFAKSQLTAEDLMPLFELDAEVPISIFDRKLITELDALSPYGNGNPLPVFLASNLVVKNGVSLLSRDTLKFWVSDTKLTAQAVGFKKADLYPLVKSANNIDLVFTPSWDTWGGNDCVQLEVKDLKPSAA